MGAYKLPILTVYTPYYMRFNPLVSYKILILLTFHQLKKLGRTKLVGFIPYVSYVYISTLILNYQLLAKIFLRFK